MVVLPFTICKANFSLLLYIHSEIGLIGFNYSNVLIYDSFNPSQIHMYGNMVFGSDSFLLKYVVYDFIYAFYW